MKIENMLQRFSRISFLFKPPWITQRIETRWEVLLKSNNRPFSWLFVRFKASKNF